MKNLGNPESDPLRRENANPNNLDAIVADVRKNR